VLDGDIVQIIIDGNRLQGSIDLIGDVSTPPEQRSAKLGSRILAGRALRRDLAPHPNLPADTRLWSAMQEVSGGPWGGCVFDVDAIVETLKAGTSIFPRPSSIAGRETRDE
jgi:hypothetical protein